MVNVQQSRASALAILGLTGADDNEDTIRKAYKRLALQHHPDKNRACPVPLDALCRGG
jgi:curved DNA-binding protein CbpA